MAVTLNKHAHHDLRQRGSKMALSDGKASDKRSLDQLKHLDSLPDFQDQLHTANALCTTAERASMILRWLTEKMKASQGHLISPESWTLFISTLRLVPPQRVAAHLGSSNLIEILRKATVQCQSSIQLLGQISEAIHLILAISRSAQGAHVATILRSSNDQAAAFVTTWLEASLLAGGHKTIDISPALEIWRLRKQGPDDDDLFSTHCLLWAAKLTFRDFTSLQSFSKRRDDSQLVNTHDVAEIRRLLAKHVLLPFRTSFFAEEGTDDLRVKLQAFQSSHADLQVLPELLDIAANLVPVMTPKQRRDESRWVEAVFRTMTTLVLSCREIEQQVELVCALLKVVLACNFSISKDTLSDVVTDFTMLLESDSSDVRWNIIALLAQSDPSLFLEEPFASALFEKLPAGPLRESGQAAQPTLNHNIVTSVVRCFATYHRLTDYFLLLENQVKRRTDTPWTQLSLDNVLEAIPAASIIAQIDRYTAWLKPGLPVNEVRGGITLLQNLLNTHFDDETWTQLYRRCGIIFDLCMELVKTKSKVVCPQLWSLARAAFELWFPLWTLYQTDNLHAPTEIGISILSVKKLWKAAETDEGALALLITVCLAFRTYPDLTRFYDDMVEKLKETGRLGLASKVVPAFALHSESIAHQTNLDQRELLLEYVTDTSAEGTAQTVDSLIVQLQSGNERQEQIASYVLARVPPSLIARSQKHLIELCKEKQQGSISQKAADFQGQDHLQILEALRQSPDPATRQAILQAFRCRLDHLGTGEKLRAVEEVLNLALTEPSGALALLRETLSTLDVRSLEELDPDRKRYDLFMRIICLVNTTSSHIQYRHATECVTHMLRDARPVLNQHSVEATLAVFSRNLKQAHESSLHLVILDACKVFKMLLQKHEHRLQGRFHMVALFLQELFTALLRSCNSNTSVPDSVVATMNVQQATAVAQSVKFVCSPRQRTRLKATAVNLSDDVRKAKAQIGAFVRYVIHHYCAEVLKYPPNDEVKKALTPALWAMIEAIVASGEGAMESLAAAMNNNQRGIFRSVYDDWKAFGKWKPGANDE